MTTSETLCVLFNDIVSSTEHMLALGQDDAEPQFREYREATQRLVDDRSGHHYRWLGDGFLAAFNSTARALEAALELQQLSFVVADGFDSRTGVAIGEVATHSDGELFGRTLVVASRLCDLAKSGEILCSATISLVVASHTAFSFEQSGVRELKGIPEPEPTVTLHRPPAQVGQQRESVALVGRSAELRRLTERITATVGGAGGLSLISGEPGAGKTRLAKEIVDRADMRGFQVVWSTSFAGGASAALTITDGIVDQLNTGDSSFKSPGSELSSPSIVSLVNRDWAESGISTESHDSLTPNERRAAAFDALWRLIESRSNEEPVLLVFDDLHWADRSSIDLIRFLGQRSRTAPVMLLVTYRTTELNVDELVGDIRDDVFRNTQELIELEGLSRGDGTALGEVLVGGKLDEELADYLYGATGGNPFLVEELIHHSAQTSSIERRDGRWRLRAGFAATVPPSVRHQLQARLRSLGDLESSIVEWIAAAGRPVPVQDLLAISDEDEMSTIEAIDRAQSTGILLAGVGGYDFVHPLLRDAVTTAISDLKLAVYRRDFALWLASTPSGYQSAAEIANLLHKSRQLGLSETGVEYALIGSQQAESAGDSAGAALLLRMAGEQLADSDDRQIDLACAEALALTWAIDPTAADVVIGAIDKLEAAGRSSDEFIAQSVGAMRQAYSSVDSLRRVVDRGLLTVGNKVSAPAGVVILFGMAFGPETDEYPGIEPQNLVVQRLYEAIKDSTFQDQHRWGHRVGSGGVDHAKTLIEPDIRLYYGGDLSTIDDLRTEAESAERTGRYGRAAALWSTAARCAIARGELSTVDELVARAEQDLENLPPEADVRYHLLAVTDELNTANGIQTPLEVVRGYEVLIPSISATFMMANFRSSIGRLYADVDERASAVSLLDASVAAINLSGPAAATYLRVLWNCLEIVWHLNLTKRCQWLRDVYETRVIPGGWRTPMTNEYLALARLAAVEGHLEQALGLFDTAGSTAEEHHALPIQAFSLFDSAVAIQRCGGSASEAIGRLNDARAIFDRYGASEWPKRVDELSAEIAATAVNGDQALGATTIRKLG